MLASVLEGLFHQFILHRGQKKLLGGALYIAYHKHSIEHHPAYRGEDYHRDAPDDEAKISLGPWMMPATYVLTSPVTIVLWLTLGPVAGWTFLATLLCYYMAYEFLHWHMHFTRPDGKPRFYHSWAPSKQLFLWFDRRHYIHHMADDRNFNVVLPIYDLALGRYSVREDQVPWAVRKRKARAASRADALRKTLAGRE